MENSLPCGKPEKPHSMPFIGFYPQSYPHVHWEWGCCMSNSPVNGQLSIVNGRWQLTVDNQKISTPPCSLSDPIPWAYPQSYPHLWITSGGKLPSLWKPRNPLFRRPMDFFQISFQIAGYRVDLRKTHRFLFRTTLPEHCRTPVVWKPLELQRFSSCSGNLQHIEGCPP